jgi:hypothetical protein
MIDIAIQIALTFGVLVSLGCLWFGLQLLVRRFFPAMASATGDPFRARFGCGGCHTGACDPGDEPAEAC